MYVSTMCDVDNVDMVENIDYSVEELNFPLISVEGKTVDKT